MVENFIFLLNYFFTLSICMSFLFFISFITIVIPHLGHAPGVSLITSGCMVQVYFTDVFINFVVSVLADKEVLDCFVDEPEHAANTRVVTSAITVIIIILFIEFYFKKLI